MALVEAEQCPNFITANTVLGYVTAILGYVSSIELLGYRNFSSGCRFLGTGKKRNKKLFLSACNVTFSNIGQFYPKEKLNFFQHHS